MPLLSTALKEQLEALFAQPPATHTACAQAWANAMQTYAAAIVPPAATITAAAAALTTALASAFAQQNIDDIESAFSAFADSVATGMVSYTAVAPTAPVGFEQLFSGSPPNTHALAAQQISDLIHTWMLTGTSTLVAPPNTVLTWS